MDDFQLPVPQPPVAAVSGSGDQMPVPTVPTPVQPAPIPASNQPQAAEMVFTNTNPVQPASEVQLAQQQQQQQQGLAITPAPAGPPSGMSYVSEVDESGEYREKCRGAPGLDNEPLFVSWDVVRTVVFNEEARKMAPEVSGADTGKMASSPATRGAGTGDAATAGAAGSRQSPMRSGTQSPTRDASFKAKEAEMMQGFDVKQDVMTVVISTEDENVHSKHLHFLHHMKDVDLSSKPEPSLSRQASKLARQESEVAPPEIPDDEELEIQRSVLHLKSNFTRSNAPESLWENFEITATHLVGEDMPASCLGFAGAGHVLRRMNMAFHGVGGKFAATPVAVSGDYRFGAVVQGKRIKVKMLSGGTVLCDFEVAADEEATMLGFSDTGDILIAVLRKNNTSYVKAWSVITSDKLKVLDDPEIFPQDCLALASISKDKKSIFVLVAQKGLFNVGVYSLAATSPTKKLDSSEVQVPAKGSAEAVRVNLPFNPFQFFMFEYAESPKEPKSKKNLQPAFVWKSMLRHRVSNIACQDRATNAATQLLKNVGQEGVGMVSSDKEQGVFCQVFKADKEQGIHLFDALEGNTGEIGAPAQEQTNVIRMEKKSRNAYAACVPSDQCVVLWDDAGELCHIWSHKRKVTSIEVSPDGAVVVVGVSGKEAEAGLNVNIEMAQVIIYSLITLEEIYRYNLPFDVAIARLDFEPPNRRLVVQYESRGTVTVTDQGPGVEESLWDQLRLDEMETISSLTGTMATIKGGSASRPAYADAVAITNDGFFFFSMTNVTVGTGKGATKMQELALGSVGVSSGLRKFYLVPGGMEKFKASQTAGSGATGVKVWCTCISGWGATIGVGLTHKKHGERKKHYVVVMSASSLKTLMVASVEMEPRGLCIEQEQVTVMGDNAQPASFAEKEAFVITYSAITGAESGKARHKVVGRTLGLTAAGTQRVAQSEDGRIFIEQIESGETIFQIQDRSLIFKGVGAGGKLLALVRPEETEGSPAGMFLKDVNNMDRFGPSRETCQLWFDAAGGVTMTANDVSLTLSRYKHVLAKWPLLFLEDWSQIFSKMFNLCVSDRDYGPFKVLIESCPHFWAGTKYYWEEEEKEEEKAAGFLGGLPGLDLGGMPGLPMNMPNVNMPSMPKIPKIPGTGKKKKGKDGAEEEERPKVWKKKPFWSKALDNNDKIFVQMLLDGVLDMINDGSAVPVREMEQVTEFIVESIEKGKMQEKVEAFLADLPLLHVPNAFHNELEEDVVAAFPGGDVIKTAWSTRSAPLSATAFSYLKDAGKAGEGERGYRYVAALPGLTKMDTLAAFTSPDASPALVDNETMRNTIDSLEETTSDFLLGMPWDWTLFPFVLTLICFCCLVFFCATAEVSFAQLIEGDAERFGLVMGCCAVIGHIVFLYFEFIEFKTSEGPWFKKTIEYFSGGFWNVLPFLGNIMGIITFLLVVNDSSKTQIRAVAAFSMLSLWFNLFNYLRAYRKGSALVKMLIEIMKDMGYFVGVVVVLIFSFAGAFYALHGRLNPVELGIEGGMCSDGPDDNTFENLPDALSNTFLISILGAFDISQFRSPYDLALGETGVLTNISFFFFFLLVILISVVALNALIAIMGSTYGRVEEAQQAVTYQEIAAIIYDKLRFRHFHSAGAKEKFERDNRWTHVLSPSESGSMPQARANSKQSGNPTLQLKKDMRENQTRTETELVRVQDMLRAAEELAAEKEVDPIDTEALNEAVTQIGALPNEVREIRHDVTDIHKQIAPENQTDAPQWARELMVAVRSGGLGGKGGGDGYQTLRELQDLKQQIMTLKSGLEEQWGAYNDMRVRLDAHGLQQGAGGGGGGGGAAASRSGAAPSRSMRAAAHAATAFHPTGGAGAGAGAGAGSQGGNQV